MERALIFVQFEGQPGKKMSFVNWFGNSELPLNIDGV
jgi:hypothetical protein